eukprot:c18011_g1_i1 orf=28-807(+)
MEVGGIHEHSRKLVWAAQSSHLGGFPRRLVLKSGSAISKLITSFLNTTHVHNYDTLGRLVNSRPPGTPLITVSNHMTTLDDPLMWGIKGLSSDPKLARWVLTADDICFTNPIFSYFFRLGKCIPITRGAGIYQPHMYEALERLNEGDWVMPENYWYGRRPLLPLWFKNISIVVGEPMQFDIPSLRQAAEEAVRRVYSTHYEGSPLPELSNTVAPVAGCPLLEDKVLHWLYSNISDQIRTVMQDLVFKAKALNSKMDSNN